MILAARRQSSKDNSRRLCLLTSMSSISPNVISIASPNQKSRKQIKSWTSFVYAHFCPPSIVEEDGKVTYVFVCKRWVTGRCFAHILNLVAKVSLWSNVPYFLMLSCNSQRLFFRSLVTKQRRLTMQQRRLKTVLHLPNSITMTWAWWINLTRMLRMGLTYQWQRAMLPLLKTLPQRPMIHLLYLPWLAPT